MTHEEFDKIYDYSLEPELILQDCSHIYMYYGLRQNMDKLDNQIKEKIYIIEQILKTVIPGFVHFYNFKKHDENMFIRYSVNYNHHSQNSPFVGVGYIDLKDLIQKTEQNEA